jgi:Glycosyltransferase family 87
MTVGQLVVMRTRAGMRASRRMVGTRSYSASDLAIGAYVVILGVFVAFRLLGIGPWDSPGFDLHAYWSTRAGLDYATTRPGDPGAFLYSPAFAHLISPITVLPWPAFAALWTAIGAGLLVWLTGRWALLVLVLLPVLMSVTIGQVDLLMAAAIVVGFRWPAAWALPILTKVTPGVGLLWFAVRREWRSLAIALGATAAIVVVSVAINANAWLGWLGMLSRGQFPRAEDGWYFDVPLGFRLAMAVIVIIWGARTDRRWVVPLAAVLGMPTVWINSPTILVAVIPLIAAGASTPAGRWLRRGDAVTAEIPPAPSAVEAGLRA